MNYIVENPNSNYKEEVNNIITNSKAYIFNFFNSPIVDLPVNVYIYKDIESLVNGMRTRGFKDMPNYMCACQKDEDNSLNFFEPKDNPTDKEWSKDEYKNVIFHELIHSIQYNLFGKTPEWINEGIAKYLDGTYKSGIKYLLDNYINICEIPNQYEIENEFGMHNYDSYDYAYLMVSYIIDAKGKNYLIELLKDKNKLEIEKKGLLKKSIDYYNLKYIKTPNELLDYMNKNIRYGFIDTKGNKYCSPGSKEWIINWFDNGIVQNFETLLDTKIGTCWDQVEFERKWFSDNNYEFKTFFCFFENDKPLPTHTFLVYKEDNKYYWFENSFEIERGIHEYDSIDKLINSVMDKQFKYALEERGAIDEDRNDIRCFEYTLNNKNMKITEYLDLMFEFYYKKKR